MAQETPIFMPLYASFPVASSIPASKQAVVPPFFLFPCALRRGIGTAPVAVTISLRATPAAGNVVLPETSGKLSFSNYGSSGDPGFYRFFNFISSRKKALGPNTWRFPLRHGGIPKSSKSLNHDDSY